MQVNKIYIEFAKIIDIFYYNKDVSVTIKISGDYSDFKK